MKKKIFGGYIVRESKISTETIPAPREINDGEDIKVLVNERLNALGIETETVEHQEAHTVVFFSKKNFHPSCFI